MTALTVTLWCSNIVLDTAGQLAFKRAALDATPGDACADDGLARWRRMATRPWLWAGMTCFAIQFFCWLAFLSLVPLSRGVLLGSINIVVLMLAGRILFAERLSRWRVVGIALIGLGVAVVGLGCGSMPDVMT